MDWQNLDEKMNSLRQCMDVGDYAKATKATESSTFSREISISLLLITMYLEIT